MQNILERFKEASSFGGFGVILMGAVMWEENVIVACALFVAGLAAVLKKEFGVGDVKPNARNTGDGT